MNFFLFLLFYFICTIILLIIFLLLYKFYLKKLIHTKLSENVLLSAFDSLDQKSILDVNISNDNEEEKNEKVYTYF